MTIEDRLRDLLVELNKRRLDLPEVESSDTIGVLFAAGAKLGLSIQQVLEPVDKPLA